MTDVVETLQTLGFKVSREQIHARAPGLAALAPLATFRRILVAVYKLGHRPRFLHERATTIWR